MKKLIALLVLFPLIAFGQFGANGSYGSGAGSGFPLSTNQVVQNGSFIFVHSNGWYDTAFHSASTLADSFQAAVNAYSIVGLDTLYSNSTILLTSNTYLATFVVDAGIAYNPNGFNITNPMSSAAIRVIGQGVNKTVFMADSNVINQTTGLKYGIARLELEHCSFIYSNAVTFGAVIRANGNLLSVHDFYIGYYPHWIVAPIEQNPSNYVRSMVVGIIDNGGLGNQHIYDGTISGVADGIVTPAEHQRIENVEFWGIGVVYTNAAVAWGTLFPSNDSLSIVIPGTRNLTPADLAVGAAIIAPFSDTKIINNKTLNCRGVVYRPFATQTYGTSQCSGWSIEGGLYDFVVEDTNFMTGMDFFGNSEVGNNGKIINNFSSLSVPSWLTVSNFVLTSFSDSGINGTWQLKSNTQDLTAGNLNTCFAVWTNTAPLAGNVIYLNPSGSGFSAGMLVVSNANGADQYGYVLTLPPPIQNDSGNNWQIGNGAGTTGAINFYTNTASAVVYTLLKTNFECYAGGSLIVSNGTIFGNGSVGLSAATARMATNLITANVALIPSNAIPAYAGTATNWWVGSYNGYVAAICTNNGANTYTIKQLAP